MNSKIIAVDFDGTLCENKWPEIGEANEDMIYYLRKRKETNHSKESSKVFLEDEMYGSNGGICRASAASQQTGSWLWRQNRTLGRDGRCVYLPKLPGVHF